ncbi:hypothetical protein GE061_013319 [Apolygus lucorum]|uniref:Uncharacterized protein n=1 Tax=Apolygus lucorum TaxID=248454 RepID=A0A8S9XQ98_APOLU|nr:hypothetical protein GE061_013319 [Apolygus lucorum]
MNNNKHVGMFPGIQVVNSSRYLGGVIGPRQNKESYVAAKVSKWVDCLTTFAELAKDSPQAVDTAFVKSLQREWAYLHRVVDGCKAEYEPLRDAIRYKLIPEILGWTPTDNEAEMCTLPTKLGGLAVEDPTKSVDTTCYYL